MDSKKTDNGNLHVKLELRRYMLRKYHADNPPAVIDCCQGQGVIWGILRKEFSVASYWGLDVKSKKGRLKIASERILGQPGWKADVVDVDTYGSPWAHWVALVANLPGPLTVFLTIGQIQFAGSPLITEAREALGIGALDVPNAISARLNKIAVSYILTRTCDDIIITEAVEAVSHGNARYLGIRIAPAQKTNGRGTGIPGRSERNPSIQEMSHV